MRRVGAALGGVDDEGGDGGPEAKVVVTGGGCSGVDDEGGDGSPEAKGMGARGGIYGEGGMALLLRRAGWSRCCWEVGGVVGG